MSLELLEGRIAPAGLISLGDARIAEGDNGETPILQFAVTRTGDLNPQVTVSYHTEDGSARSGVDYSATAGTVTIASGAATGTISVPITGNQLLQLDRNFRVVLDDVVDVNIPFSLSTQTTFATGLGPEYGAFGDLNGDGRPDLVVANSGDDTISLLRNTTAPGEATPSFATQQTIAVGIITTSVAIGDINGDGRPDLAVSSYRVNEVAGGVSVLLNTGAPGASTFSFSGPTPFATGGGPNSVNLVDVNGDGKLDLALSTGRTNGIAVLLNTTIPGAATPSFASPQTFPTGFNSFRGLSVADFNGDGSPDLAVVVFSSSGSSLSSGISVILNTTTPGSSTASFSSPMTFPTNVFANGLSVGDLNGDGLPDLAVSVYRGNNVSILLNNTIPGATTPSFLAQQVIPNVPNSAGVAIGDLNGDGKPDLAISGYGSASLSVLLNTTSPGAPAISFEPLKSFPVGASPIGVVLGDVNGDGKPDGIVFNYYGNDEGTNTGTVSVLLNTSPLSVTPTFTVKQDFATGNFPASVAAGDLNGDGLPDLAVANASSNSVSVFLNSTVPGATSPSFAVTTIDVGRFPKSVAIGDLNGDGKLDLAFTEGQDATVSVLLNMTTPGSLTASFASRKSFAPDASPRFVAIGDFNGDGKPDLATANSRAGTVSVLLNTTNPGSLDPSFASQVSFPVGVDARAVAIGDLNGDGRPDLVAANYGNRFSNDLGTVSVLLNTTDPGAGVPSFADQAVFGAGLNPYAVAVGDLNGDGRPDVAVGNYRSDFLSILLNTTAPGDSTASLATQQQVTVGRNGPLSIVIADANNDGKPDITTADYFKSNAMVLANSTVPGSAAFSFAEPIFLPAGSRPYSVALADLNGDGKPDVAVANAGSATLSVLINTTTPSATIARSLTPAFSAPQVLSDQPYPGIVASADINGDGLPDLVVTQPTSGGVAVFFNTTPKGSSTSSFAPGVTFAGDTSPYRLAIGDLNGDGRPDLVMLDFRAKAILVLLNTTEPGSLTPSFADSQSFSSGEYPQSIELADVNGDDRPDLLFTNYFANTLTVLLNTTTPGSSTVGLGDPTTVDVGDGAAGIAVGDLNGDGRQDVAVIHRQTTNAPPGVTILVNTTVPGATVPNFSTQDVPTGPAPTGLVIADLNGDGRPDMVVGDYADQGTLRVFLNATPNESGTVLFDPEADFVIGSSPRGLIVGDLDGDGRLDLIAANALQSEGGIAVLLNTTPTGSTAASFAPKLVYPTGQYPGIPAVADINGDGRPDLIVSEYYGGVSVWLNTTSGNISKDPSIATGTIVDDDAAASIEAASSEGQTTLVGTAFPSALSVVVKNARGHVVQGVSVTFSTPTEGASALFGGSQSSVSVLTDSDGVATAPSLIANGVVGAYVATAQAEGLASTVDFHLANVTSVVGSLTAVGWGSRSQAVAGRTYLPFANISTISVTFNSAVVPTISDLTIIGRGGRVYAVTSVSVVGNRVIWTLGSPISDVDVVTVKVNPRLADYSVVLRVLPGDVNDDGIVNGQDLVVVRNAFTGLGPAATVPPVFLDLNGDGVIDVLDYNIVRKFMGKKLR